MIQTLKEAIDRAKKAKRLSDKEVKEQIDITIKIHNLIAKDISELP